LGQGAPTLRIETEVAGLPSELFYGSVKVKPLRLRPGTNTPITIDDSDFFVNQQYVDFLSRFPDQNGLNYWNSQITACGANADCIRISRDNTSGAFFLSIEFQETGYLVERMYKTAYGDATGQSTCCVQGTPSHTISVPIIKRSEFLPDTLQISNGVVVGVGNWQTQLENNKVAFANAFVARARFLTDFPNTLTATEFVNKLNTNAGSPLSSSESAALIADLGSGSKTRAQVVRAVAEDPDLASAEKNKAFVLMQYLGYLRRDPNSGPDADHTGYDFWLQKLSTNNGDFHAAQMVRAFIESIEYRNRF
jgi:hypothetical protein